MSVDLLAKWDQEAEVWLGKWDRLSEYYTDDVVFHMPPFPDIVGIEALKETVIAFNAGFPDFQGVTDEAYVVGDTTFGRFTMSATFTGQTPLMPIPPTGKKAVGLACIMVHWRNGKIAEVWHVGDWLGWLTQFGVITPME